MGHICRFFHHSTRRTNLWNTRNHETLNPNPKQANLFSEAKQRVKLKDRFGAEMGEAFAGFGGDDDLEAAGRFRFQVSGFVRVQGLGFLGFGV
jgi:hypothetical protein